MATRLLLIIYIAYIGLGIPDSLFGTAWPAIYADFGLPISFASFVTVILSCGTIVSSMISAKLIHRLETNRVSFFSTLATAGALLGFSFSPNLWLMCLLAVPLGLGAGAIDVALNNYVALRYSATHMSFLHCFYGVGVVISPYVLSLVIRGPYGWRGGYQIAFCIQMGIALLLLLTLPLWHKVPNAERSETQETLLAPPLKDVLRIPGIKLMCSLFVASCAIEFTCGGWASTFLVEYKHMSTDHAARMVMLYYVGMTLGRFLSGVFSARFRSWSIIRIGQWILGVALVVLLLPGPSYLAAAGLFLIGLGNGPLFPNFSYLTPQNFGRELSRSVIGIQMASAYIGIMLAPLLCGLLVQEISMGIFPLYLLLFYLLMIVVTIRVKGVLKVSS